MPESFSGNLAGVSTPVNIPTPCDPREALEALGDPARKLAFIDVRSEGEAEETGIDGFVNLPILNNEHRHLVGICYKQRGQAAAIELGHRLVGPIRDQMIARWMSEANAPGIQGTIVTCWRGGLRSKLASEWLCASGVDARIVAGGYKAMRRILLESLEKPPRLVLLCGLTGAGKTRFLVQWRQQNSEVQPIDLEAAAKHRGSSFGAIAGQPQPRQAVFENLIASKFFKARQKVFLLEDESKLIGRLSLPVALDRKMNTAPRVILRARLEERASWIFKEYVSDPLASGTDPRELESRLGNAIERLSTKLGSQRKNELAGALQLAFRSGGTQLEPHLAWIEPLLLTYYDPMYEHSKKRRSGTVLFEGDATECERFLAEEFRHPEPAL